MNDNLAYQEEYKEEMLNGEIVLMSPSPTVNHNIISENICTIFKVYLKGKPCIPFGDGTDLHLTDKDCFVPDGMIVCDRNKIKTTGVYGAPNLVLEILSPSTSKRDRGYKKNLYEKCGVTEYWIVSPKERSIEVYLLKDGKYILDNIYIDYPDYELERMTEEEKANVITDFKCHLYDDLIISLDDIFSDTL